MLISLARGAAPGGSSDMADPLGNHWRFRPRKHPLRAVARPRPERGETILVWDIGVRVFHWVLLAAVSVAALTGFVLGRTTLAWHLIAGTVVAVAIAWRIVWGAFGPTYARFASFFYPPTTIVAHLRDVRSGQRVRHLGHNPLGAVMVFALLAVLTAIVLTGTVALGGMLKQGPLRAFLTYRTGLQWLGTHNALAILLLALVGGHLAGVAFESWRGQENLVGAMLSGRKPAHPPAEATAHVDTRLWTAMAIILGVVAAGAAAIAALAALPGRGVPSAKMDPVFAEQCGDCHLAFPPSLAPSATWDRILAEGKHHFGTEMGLSSDEVAHIKAYLDANSAEHWDTLPSHLLRVPAPNGSLRISDTPGWRQAHQDIPASVFAAKPIYGRSSCEACHADAATGQFAPQNIAIPKTAPP